MNYIGIYFSLSNKMIFNTVRYYEVVQIYVAKIQYKESNWYQFKCKYLSTAIIFQTIYSHDINYIRLKRFNSIPNYIVISSKNITSLKRSTLLIRDLFKPVHRKMKVLKVWIKDI